MIDYGFIWWSFARDSLILIESIKSVKRVYPDSPLRVINDAHKPITGEQLEAVESLGVTVINDTTERLGNLNGLGFVISQLGHYSDMLETENIRRCVKVDSDVLILPKAKNYLADRLNYDVWGSMNGGKVNNQKSSNMLGMFYFVSSGFVSYCFEYLQRYNFPNCNVGEDAMFYFLSQNYTNDKRGKMQVEDFETDYRKSIFVSFNHSGNLDLEPYVDSCLEAIALYFGDDRKSRSCKKCEVIEIEALHMAKGNKLLVESRPN